MGGSWHKPPTQTLLQTVKYPIIARASPKAVAFSTGQCTLPHRKNCSGMARELWQKAQGVVLGSEFPRASMGHERTSLIGSEPVSMETGSLGVSFGVWHQAVGVGPFGLGGCLWDLLGSDFFRTAHGRLIRFGSGKSLEFLLCHRARCPAGGLLLPIILRAILCPWHKIYPIKLY